MGKYKQQPCSSSIKRGKNERGQDNNKGLQNHVKQIGLSFHFTYDDTMARVVNNFPHVPQI